MAKQGSFGSLLSTPDTLMCGIAAYFSIHTDASHCKTIVDAMCDIQASRGPDGKGSLAFALTNSSGSIGHRRLAIIDPASGAQPMSFDDDGLHLTYNGEIYNFRELRRELQESGTSFTTDSDTEVVLAAYRHWGEKCVDHFRGMFAFAIFDAKRQVVFVARDHFGIKPLVYTSGPGWFAIASEIRALRCLPEFSGEVDHHAIASYLHFGYIPAAESAFTGVSKLRPGHALKFNTSTADQISEPVRYWEPTLSPEKNGDPAEWAIEVERVCKNSVAAHMVADVEFGAFLSGGVDSTLIAKWMTEVSDQKVRTYTISYDDSEHDETPWARKAAATLGVNLIETKVEANAIEILPKLVAHLGEPMADRSMISTWLVCEQARREVPMVLSGDGADENFFGYESYLGWIDQREYLNKIAKQPGGLLIRKILGSMLPQRYPRIIPPDDHEALLWDSLAQIPRSILHREKTDIPRAKAPDNLTRLIDRNLSGGPDYLLQATDLEYYLPYDILFKVDAASMAHGLEVRTPFIDREVFEVARRMPLACRHGLGPHGKREGKIVLKQILATTFANDFAFRKKQGFLPPVANWLKAGTSERRNAEERLRTSDSGIRNLLSEPLLGKIAGLNNGRRLWNMLILDEWLQQAK